MFLSRLSDIEKAHFYRLAQMAAEANGEVKYEESSYLDVYAQEMSLGIGVLDSIEKISSQDIIQVFSESESSHKRIIMFETIAFMYVDGTFDEDERTFTYRFAEDIGFPKQDVDDIINLVERYVVFLTEIANSILHE